MSKQYEFKHWQVEEAGKGVTEFRAPSTQGAITVRGGAISFAGNLTNLTGDEQDEVPEVLSAALARQAEHRAPRKTTAEAAAPAPKPESK